MAKLSQVLLAAWQKRGPLAMCLWPLTLFSRLYLLWQAMRYALGWASVTRLPVPVMVVGNVVVGGTGKTPIVMHIADHLILRGYKVGVIARGVGGQQRGCAEVSQDSLVSLVGDEALLLKKRLGLPVFIGKARAQAALLLMKQYPDTQIIISDDGLQHSALHHDIAVCVFDDRGLGNGFLLPAGPLRESWPRHLNQNVVQIKVHTGQQSFEDSFPALRKLSSQAVNGRGDLRDLDTWQHHTVDALAAIAQPHTFFTALQAARLSLGTTQTFPDHDSLQAWTPPSARDVLCTEKDAVKLWPRHPGVWAVPLQCELPEVFWLTLLPHIQRLSLPDGLQIT
jgi:tetraacyldisaccharide 4'-kinase